MAEYHRPGSGRQFTRSVLYWTVLIEGFTCLLRFGAGLQSTRDTASTIGRLTFGLRIHHGYIGLIVISVAAVLSVRRRRIADSLMIIGVSLVLSDLIHHFVVLWIFTGSPQFDLFY